MTCIMIYSKEFYEKYIKPWRKKHPEKVKQYNKEYKARWRNLVLYRLGERCVICNRTNTQSQLIAHEIHGKPHNRSYKRIFNQLEDYVLLCRPHHASIHRLKNEGRLEIMIELLIKLLAGTRI